jgi:hypothetical protein
MGGFDDFFKLLWLILTFTAKSKLSRNQDGSTTTDGNTMFLGLNFAERTGFVVLLQFQPRSWIGNYEMYYICSITVIFRYSILFGGPNRSHIRFFEAILVSGKWSYQSFESEYNVLMAIKVFTTLSIYWVFRGEWTRTQQTNLEQHIQDSRGRSYNSAASTQRSTV